MGLFIWHDWAHLVAVAASVCKLYYPMCTRIALYFVDTVWAGFWGLVYRKFFWDFVNGTLRNPGGIQYVNYLGTVMTYNHLTSL